MKVIDRLLIRRSLHAGEAVTISFFMYLFMEDLLIFSDSSLLFCNSLSLSLSLSLSTALVYIVRELSLFFSLSLSLSLSLSVLFYLSTAPACHQTSVSAQSIA